MAEQPQSEENLTELQKLQKTLTDLSEIDPQKDLVRRNELGSANFSSGVDVFQNPRRFRQLSRNS